ncbi:hypothetical protein [Streptomyces cavernae]|uniref:hypothetical protein n=1 Tax=Streptomyces cavernae TaxID=2259034 RepID=UPI000FEBA9FA|nr:hypothetical protein [Streptomyces cavernae]
MTTTPDNGTRPLNANQRAELAALLGDVEPVPDSLVMTLGALIRDRRENDHPQWEDLSRHNLAGYMGDRMAPVLRRLLDREAENERLRANKPAAEDATGDLTPLTVHWDRLVTHPSGEDTDTIVCCLTDTGQPVALFLDDEHREALGLLLVEPDPDNEQPATFFQRDRVYTNGTGFTAPEVTTYFRVEHVTRHPDRGHLRAIGWARTGEPGAGWHGDFRDEDEFTDWTDVTDAFLAAEAQRDRTATEPGREDS